jgi:hypothetical protein
VSDSHASAPAPVIVSRVAHAEHGDHRFMGYSAFRELLGHESMTGLLALSILGRRVDDDVKTALDLMANCASAADPRIWPLKAARVAASYGEALAGFAAGQLAMMGPFMSPRTIGEAAEQLARLRAKLDAAGADPADVERVVRDHIAGGRLGGYGVPLRAEDERYVALRGAMTRVGRHTLPHWSAQELLSATMRREKKLEPNVGIALAAALLDIGCTPAQARFFATNLFGHTMIANAFEASEERSAAMQKLPLGTIRYAGKAPRTSPRAG